VETDVGVMALTNQNETIIENSNFLSNQAHKKAVFQIDTKSNVTIRDSLFQQNIASAGISLGSVTDCGRFFVSRTQFKENKALNESYCLSIMQTANATFDDCHFDSNFAAKGSSNLEASYFSKLYITKSTFKIHLEEMKLLTT
jgi:hypothetical protein